MRELFAGKEAQLPTGKIHPLHPCENKVPIYIAASGRECSSFAGRIADGIIVLVGVADEYIAHAEEKIAAGAKAARPKLIRYQSGALGSRARFPIPLLPRTR